MSTFTPKKASKIISTKKEDDLDRRQQEIRDLLKELIENNNIVLKDADNRNIIFVGKTKSGKSTALTVLKTPFHFVGHSSVFSDTVDAKISHFTVEVEGEDNTKKNFNIGVIDTPGLFEVVDKGTARDQHALETLIIKCMKSEVTKINMIFFVVSYTGSVNIQDIEALESFIKLFKGAENFVNVLVTRCESLSEKEKKRIEAEFRSYPKLSELLSKVNSKVYFTGAVEQSSFENGYVDKVKDGFANVLDMRETIFFDIFSRSDYFELKSLEMADNVRVRAEAILQDIIKRYENRETNPDPMTLKAKCKELGTCLPLLEAESYKKANGVLMDCQKYLEEVEKSVAATSPVASASAV